MTVVEFQSVGNVAERGFCPQREVWLEDWGPSSLGAGMSWDAHGTLGFQSWSLGGSGGLGRGSECGLLNLRYLHHLQEWRPC